jgi:hypothetical protein
MDDASDNPAIIDARVAARVGWKMRLSVPHPAHVKQSPLPYRNLLQSKAYTK